MPRSSLTAPFKSFDFRLLWSAVLVSNLGGLIQAVGAGWMMATISKSDDMVALVQSATTLPIMLFSLASGAFADSFDRRRVMLAAQALMLVISAALAIFAVTGQMTPWLLLTFTFLIGCGTALHNPSWQASMGDIVPREDIPSAVTLNSMGFNLMRSIGPAIGGLVVAAAGAATAFAFNAVSYIPLIVALLRWKHQREPSKLPREAFGHAVSAGLRYVAMSPNLITVISRSFLFGLSAVAILALLPLVARDIIRGGAVTYGLLLGSFGIGAIGGALMNTRVREAFSNEVIARFAFLGFAVSAALVAMSRDLWLTCLCLLPAGACWVLALSLFNVMIQLSTPRWVVGRSLSIYQTATFGGMAAGGWLWGVVADAHDATNALLVSAAVLLAGALIGLRFPLPGFLALNLDPLNRFKEPALRLDLRSRSGPIMVMVDYDIAQEDVPAFLEAMTERRRIRIRDGARQWTLLRDLENPGTWTEAYHVPTWVEYIRHNQRRTQSDAQISERLLALHRGDDPPRVHRMVERQTVPVRDDMPIKQNPEVP
ncbi:MFS transporter [Nitratireductor sp. ZSWI3]|uniref:MFS transporter n=1 Tax=Nitratireductor sp. ZSWI3 TaxID=2966359 RepID=UPI002150492A|nr:MFS transporter [Nitratireductor sp. ZSWI3]MCR4265557.1 MFS transporter [Nitratireductor sp. ZSWI3]